jgi:hypothetical protein
LLLASLIFFSNIDTDGMRQERIGNETDRGDFSSLPAVHTVDQPNPVEPTSGIPQRFLTLSLSPELKRCTQGNIKTAYLSYNWLDDEGETGPAYNVC